MVDQVPEFETSQSIGEFPVKIRGDTDDTLIGNVGDRLKVDSSLVPISGGYPTIDEEHYRIHMGRSFIYSETFTMSLNQENMWSFTTPNSTRYSHFMWTVFSKGEILFRIHEAVTCTESTTLTPKNANRNSGNASVNVLKLVTAVSNYGTTIIYNQFGAVSSNGNGGLNAAQEIILKANTKYLLYLKSLASSNNGNPVFRWYEYDYVNDA